MFYPSLNLSLRASSPGRSGGGAGTEVGELGKGGGGGGVVLL